jgi:hypothetical protein
VGSIPTRGTPSIKGVDMAKPNLEDAEGFKVTAFSEKGSKMVKTFGGRERTKAGNFYEKHVLNPKFVRGQAEIKLNGTWRVYTSFDNSKH